MARTLNAVSHLALTLKSQKTTEKVTIESIELACDVACPDEMCFLAEYKISCHLNCFASSHNIIFRQGVRHESRKGSRNA